ncbi:D-ribose pyranase [Lachnospiraceae bacterium]|jgi:D-ribose pyranase|nr:RbsD/FucU domain-containing protein [uncultured Schaedlerella sp.]MCI9153516.1 D-ribose pyranase [Ruminococcus sp.]NBI57265.1 D-ribose pyranase [Lachnospiraceae bacterium]
MFKNGIINPQVNYNLSLLTHMDKFLVSDSAMELPKDMTRIDLAFVPNVPDVITVTKGILEECLIEKAYLAKEMMEVSKALYDAYCKLFAEYDVPIELVPHSEFCRLTNEEVRFTIRTGDSRYHFASAILVSGCPY